MSNIVYIGTSLDGYICAPDGGLDWLSYVPIPEGNLVDTTVLLNQLVRKRYQGKCD